MRRLGLALVLVAAMVAAPTAAGATGGRAAAKPKLSGPLLLADTTKDGAKGDFGAGGPDISASGDVVAFDSSATNFDPGDTGMDLDVYLKDLTTGDLTLASTSSSGVKGNEASDGASLSKDGSVVAFQSNASNLDAGDTDTESDIYVKDVATGDLTLASTSSAGVKGNAFSGLADLSGDATHVAFESEATTLDPGDTDAVRDVYVKDLTTGDLSLASTATDGTKGNDDSNLASLSSSGKRVAFTSQATNLVPGNTDGNPDVYVKFLTTGELRLVSSDASGNKANFVSDGASIDASGRYVAFSSNATNLGPPENGFEQVYVKDLSTGAVTLVSTSGTGIIANDANQHPEISGDGKHVTFASEATNLDPADISTDWDVYEKNLVTGRLTLMTDDANRVKGNQTGNAQNPALSAHGKLVAYDSTASNQDAADPDSRQDVYVKNTTTCTMVGTDGDDTLVGTAGHDVICGTEGDDTIDGGGGNDVLFGGSGNDTLQGGAGKDTVHGDDGGDTLDYEDSPAGVTVDLGAHTATGGDAEGDSFDNVEVLEGSELPDHLTGDDRGDAILGLDGEDVIAGLGGPDVLLGGDGLDTLDYGASPAKVSVDLSTGAVSGGDAEGDGIIQFEGVIGSPFKDTLTGDPGDNFFMGMAGADTIDGGDGVDLVNYSLSPKKVNIDLFDGTATGGDADGDVLTGIENLIGTPFGDTLTGDGVPNTLTGSDGNDTLNGRGSDDTLNGELGTDTFDGGNGTDDCDNVAGESATNCEL